MKKEPLRVISIKKNNKYSIFKSFMFFMVIIDVIFIYFTFNPPPPERLIRTGTININEILRTHRLVDPNLMLLVGTSS